MRTTRTPSGSAALRLVLPVAAQPAEERVGRRIGLGDLVVVEVGRVDGERVVVDARRARPARAGAAPAQRAIASTSARVDSTR